MMCAIVIGCSGAIAMSLIIRKKQVEKQRRQQVVVITLHKFSYFKFKKYLLLLPIGSRANNIALDDIIVH